jgi:GMP synthase-like glutamine amidotransferase
VASLETYEMKTVSVIQHTSSEYLGLIEDHLEGRGIRFRYFRPFTEGGKLPDPDTIRDGLVLLSGGVWGAAGTRDIPTLKQEVRLAHAALMFGSPVIGIGLGAQILAIAAGGRSAATGLAFEVTTARRVDATALNGYLPSEYPLAIYMRDWPVPPAHARVLAEDPRGRPALWQIGRRASGTQGGHGGGPDHGIRRSTRGRGPGTGEAAVGATGPGGRSGADHDRDRAADGMDAAPRDARVTGRVDGGLASIRKC